MAPHEAPLPPEREPDFLSALGCRGGGEAADSAAFGGQRATTRSCSAIDYQPSERDSSPDGSRQPGVLPGGQDSDVCGIVNKINELLIDIGAP